MRGKRILTLQDIRDAAREKRSLECPSRTWFGRCIPASFVINMCGAVILACINSGLYIYEPGRKKRFVVMFRGGDWEVIEIKHGWACDTTEPIFGTRKEAEEYKKDMKDRKSSVEIQ